MKRAVRATGKDRRATRGTPDHLAPRVIKANQGRAGRTAQPALRENLGCKVQKVTRVIRGQWEPMATPGRLARLAHKDQRARMERSDPKGQKVHKGIKAILA